MAVSPPIMIFPILLSLIIATSSLPTDQPYIRMMSDDAVQVLPWTTDNIHRAISFYSTLYGVSSSTMEHIVKNESGFNQYAIGDHGLSHGLVQINKKYHPDISIQKAEDPFFALNYLASELKAGHCSSWSTCPTKTEQLE